MNDNTRSNFPGILGSIIIGAAGFLGGMFWSEHKIVNSLREGAKRGESLYSDGKPLYVPATTTRGRGEYGT